MATAVAAGKVTCVSLHYSIPIISPLLGLISHTLILISTQNNGDTIVQVIGAESDWLQCNIYTYYNYRQLKLLSNVYC